MLANNLIREWAATNARRRRRQRRTDRRRRRRLYIVDNAGDLVIEAAGQGTDIIFARVSYTLGAGVRSRSCRRLQAGTAAINLTGNELANTIYRQCRRQRAERRRRRRHDARPRRQRHLYRRQRRRPGGRERRRGQRHRLFASVSYTLAAGCRGRELLSTITMAAPTPINLTGNELANTIYRQCRRERAATAARGNDVLIGRGGNDIYLVDNARPTSSIEAAGQGIDTSIRGRATRSRRASRSRICRRSPWPAPPRSTSPATSSPTRSIGNAGANVLDGGGGADVLIGLGGNDIYIVDNAGDQVDRGRRRAAATSSTRASSYALAPERTVETAVDDRPWQAPPRINLTGNELANTLIGNAGANVLNGGGGARRADRPAAATTLYLRRQCRRPGRRGRGRRQRHRLRARRATRWRAGVQVEILSTDQPWPAPARST